MDALPILARRNVLNPGQVLRETYALHSVPGSDYCGTHLQKWLHGSPGAPRTMAGITAFLKRAGKTIAPDIPLEAEACGHVSVYLPGSVGYLMHTDMCNNYNRRLVVASVLLEGESLIEIEPWGKLELLPGDAVAFSGWAMHRVHPVRDERRISVVAWLNSLDVPQPPSGWKNTAGWDPTKHIPSR